MGGYGKIQNGNHVAEHVRDELTSLLTYCGNKTMSCIIIIDAAYMWYGKADRRPDRAYLVLAKSHDVRYM